MEHQQEAIDIIHSLYSIEKPPWGKTIRKLHMTQGYIKNDIRYSIILLSRVMGLPATGHLVPFMVNFIETIRHAKIPLDWATTLRENLCDQLRTVKDKKKFYMVCLLSVRAKNYLGLYRKCSM